MTAVAGRDRRVVVKGSPFNSEAAIAALTTPITPIEDFYVRSNFPTPAIDLDGYRLVIDGLVERPLSLSLSDLLAMPSRTLTATLECAGNNRTRLAPIPEGEPWSEGAVSTATWTGVPLATVLAAAGVRSGAVEVRFEGADRGIPRNRTDTIHFERSLPIGEALTGEVLLVHRMNDQPLTDEHGAPLRALVAGWYGMAAVKWLRRIEVIDCPFDGHYQVRQYVYERPGVPEKPPVRWMRIKSLVTSVASGDTIATGPQEIAGVAWCGDAPVASVEVSIDAGAWQPAELIGEAVPYTWNMWRYQWAGAPPGRHSIRTRATDARGIAQPDQPDWNRLGYGNNAVQVTLVTVKG